MQYSCRRPSSRQNLEFSTLADTDAARGIRRPALSWTCVFMLQVEQHKMHCILLLGQFLILLLARIRNANCFGRHFIAATRRYFTHYTLFSLTIGSHYGVQSQTDHINMSPYLLQYCLFGCIFRSFEGVPNQVSVAKNYVPERVGGGSSVTVSLAPGKTMSPHFQHPLARPVPSCIYRNGHGADPTHRHDLKVHVSPLML